MLVEMYVEIDDFCKSDPRILKMWDISRPGPKSKLTLSEVMTILIHYHQKSYKHFKSYYTEYILGHIASDFPDAVSYNRFIELIPRTLLPMCLYLNYRCSLSRQTGIYYIDSAPWSACHVKRVHQHKVMRGFANWGKTSTGWFYGMKYHLVTNHYGELMNFYLSSGNISDANAKVLYFLTKDLKGWLFGDRGYLLNEEKKTFLEKDGLLQIFAKCRKNMKKQKISVEHKLWIRKRGIIESVIDITKSDCNATHTRHRSPYNAFTNLFAALVAYCLRTEKPKTSINLEARLLQIPEKYSQAA